MKRIKPFFYVVKGEVLINDDDAQMHYLIEFNHYRETIEMKANSDVIILFGYATPFRKSFIAYGLFVMKTKEEIMQAYEDYNRGKLGDADAF